VTDDGPGARGIAALTAALTYLIAGTDEGCTLEQIILHGTYTDGRSGYAGTARRTITPNELRAVLAEHKAMRDAITRLWKLELHAVGHTWMVANTDLARALHGHPVLDEIAAEAVTRALPDMLAVLPRTSHEPVPLALRYDQAEKDLRAARDTLRKPDDTRERLPLEDPGATLYLQDPATGHATPLAVRPVRHFSPGYEGEIPNHIGAEATCPMPDCAKARAQHEAAADIQDLTYELFRTEDAAKETPDA